MAEKNARLNLRLGEELVAAARAKAESEGVTVADVARRALEREVRSVAPDGAQVAVPDYGEQLGRMERNMDVLRQGLLAVAERQEVAMAAQAATMEAVRVLGEQVGQVMYPVLDAPAEPPALPEARQEPEPVEDMLPRSDIKERAIARYFDAGHESLQRLMSRGDRQAAQVLLERMRGRYGRERTDRELRRRQES